MEILPLGHSSFRLRGKNATLVTDPYDSGKTGKKFPKVEANIVTVSHGHEDHNATSAVGGSPFVISGPGEYDIAGIGIIGTGVYHDDQKGALRGKNTIYNIEIDGLHVVHLGDLGHTISASDVDKIDQVDVLFIPVGGVGTIGPKEAIEVISELEPRIIIPMHYADPELTPAVFGQLESLDVFLKAYGKEGTVPVPKLVLTREKLPPETTLVVLHA